MRVKRDARQSNVKESVSGIRQERGARHHKGRHTLKARLQDTQVEGHELA